jgi:Lysyl oxidase
VIAVRRRSTVTTRHEVAVKALTLVVATALVVACADDAPSARRTTEPRSPTPATVVESTTTDVLPTSSSAAPPTAENVVTDETPALELLTTGGDVTMFTSGLDGAFVELPVYLAATSGLEVRAVRPRFDLPIRASATLGTGPTARDVQLPDDLGVGWDGLPDFFEVEIRDSSGAIVDGSTEGFCPNAGERARIAPGGPDLEQYPNDCVANPFSSGAVWGISRGWAGRMEGFALDLEPGEYRVSVDVAEPYEQVLRVDVAPVEVGLTLAPQPGPGRSFGDRPLVGVVDADGDGIDDRVDDEVVDADGDGLDDRYDDFVIDVDGDGFDDMTGEPDDLVVELDASGSPSDASPAGPRPAHAGRPVDPGTSTAPDPATMPDLVALPAWGISTFSDGTLDLLSFGATTWNAGPAPLVIDGFRSHDGTGLMEAYQQFYRRGRATTEAPIGSLEFHAGGGHDHWHFLDFSRYDLVDEDGKVIQTSGKESWCLAPTDAVDLTVPGAMWRPFNTDLTTACGAEGSLWLRETLPVGWGDTYTQGVSGQAFDITDLPNGNYVIRVTANPDGNLYERSAANNVATRRITLGGSLGDRTVDVPPHEGIDSESFDPFGFGV